MNNLLKVEFFKLKRNKSFWVIAGTVMGISIFAHCLIITDWWMMTTPFDRAGLGKLNGLSMFTAPILFNLIIGSLAGFFISAEFSRNGVIRTQMISGHKRSHIYLAKYLIFSLGSVMITIIIPLITAFIITFVLGYGEVFDVENMQYLARVYSLFTLQFLGYTAIVTLLAIITEDSGKTIILSILLTIVMIFFEQFSYDSVVGFIYSHSIFQQFIDVFNWTMTGGELIKSVAVGLITIFVVLVCGVFIFNRKEIK